MDCPHLRIEIVDFDFNARCIRCGKIVSKHEICEIIRKRYVKS